MSKLDRHEWSWEAMSSEGTSFYPGLPLISWDGDEVFNDASGLTTAYCFDLSRPSITPESLRSLLLKLYPSAELTEPEPNCFQLIDLVDLGEYVKATTLGEKPDTLITRAKLEGDRLRIVFNIAPYRAINIAGGLATNAIANIEAWPALLAAQSFATEMMVQLDSGDLDPTPADNLTQIASLMSETFLTHRYMKILVLGFSMLMVPLSLFAYDAPGILPPIAFAILLALTIKLSATGHIIKNRMTKARRLLMVRIGTTVLFSAASVSIIYRRTYGEGDSLTILTFAGILLADWLRRALNLIPAKK